MFDCLSWMRGTKHVLPAGKVLVSGDAARLTVSNQHNGEYVCAPLTGRQCRGYQCRCVHLAQGRRVQIYADMLTLLKQWERQDMLRNAVTCTLECAGVMGMLR